MDQSSYFSTWLYLNFIIRTWQAGIIELKMIEPMVGCRVELRLLFSKKNLVGTPCLSFSLQKSPLPTASDTRLRLSRF